MGASADHLGAGATIAERLARSLAGTTSSLSATAMNAAMILMADHELATSTLAVRVAASVRADLYDALVSGMATMWVPFTAVPVSRPTSCW